MYFDVKSCKFRVISSSFQCDFQYGNEHSSTISITNNLNFPSLNTCLMGYSHSKNQKSRCYCPYLDLMNVYICNVTDHNRDLQQLQAVCGKLRYTMSMQPSESVHNSRRVHVVVRLCIQLCATRCMARQSCGQDHACFEQ